MKAQGLHGRERALDVIAAACVAIVATRVLLRTLPRQLAEIRRNVTEFQVRTVPSMPMTNTRPHPDPR